MTHSEQSSAAGSDVLPSGCAVGADGAAVGVADARLGGVMSSVWPAIGSADSEMLRRKKQAIRAGHLAMCLMVASAIGIPLLRSWREYPSAVVLALWVAGVGYMLWNLYGTRGIVRLVLWEGGNPPAVQVRTPACGNGVYFIVQLVLAGVVYGLANRGQLPDLVWVALLPPVAYAVFLLEWRGIAVVSLLTMGTFISCAVLWHGWGRVGYTAVAFSFAILFTLVFTLLAVHSERSRGEVVRLADELGRANHRLREYAVQAEDMAANRERNRIAREVHDSLGHYLTVVNVQIEAALGLDGVDPARAREALARARAFTREGLQDIRGSLAALRASPLENRPLAEAFRELVVASMDDPGAVALEVMGRPRALSAPAELSLFRAAQEGLTNVRKHAGAKSVVLLLDYRDPCRVVVTVKDDGVGCVAENAEGGFGLLGLRERAQLLRGSLEVNSTPGEGFVLSMGVPG
ncbi:MAG: hypothetical protein RI897_1093 [Verrucomicrobiota bacterium]